MVRLTVARASRRTEGATSMSTTTRVPVRDRLGEWASLAAGYAVVGVAEAIGAAVAVGSLLAAAGRQRGPVPNGRPDESA